MKYELVRIDELSGSYAGIYTVRQLDSGTTLLEEFIVENETSYGDEVEEITTLLEGMGKTYGVRDQFIKLREGAPGDGVCALYDHKEHRLRLYGIKYGSDLLIICGGGPKPRDIRALQEDENLKQKNMLARAISNAVYKKQLLKDIRIEDDKFIGDTIIDVDI